MVNIFKNTTYTAIATTLKMVDMDSCKEETIDSNTAISCVNDYLRAYRSSIISYMGSQYEQATEYLYSELTYFIDMGTDMLLNGSYESVMFSVYETVETAYNYIHNSIELTNAKFMNNKLRK